MHKTRQSMSNWDDCYQLDKIVEFYDAFVQTSSDYKEDDTNGKRNGRGILSKTPIAMMAPISKGSEKVQEKKNKKSTKFRFVKQDESDGRSNIWELLKKFYNNRKWILNFNHRWF